MLSTTRARAPSLAARSIATAPPSERPMTTTWLSGMPVPMGEPGPGRPRIGENSRFARHAFAAAIAAIVEPQHGHADPAVKNGQRTRPGGHVPLIAVAEEHDGQRLLVRQEPAMQLRAVGRLKPGILETRCRADANPPPNRAAG